MFTFFRSVMRLVLSASTRRLASVLRSFLRLLIFAAVLTGLLYLVQVVPEYQVKRASVRSTAPNPEAKTTPADVAAMQNEMRKTFIQVIGGAFALAALYFTYRRVNIAEQGHITDRYTKAIEQLGSIRADNQPNIEVRLGGIYALERIAIDSIRDQMTIIEVLTAYVRQNAPAPVMERSAVENQFAIANGPATDIKAILAALGRRRRRKVWRDTYALDLRNSDLRGADLKGLHLEHVHFDHSCLDGIKCDDAFLNSSSFRSASLIGASFFRADLLLTRFDNASLGRASFYEAQIQSSDFSHASLNETEFSYAHLEGTRFRKANLEGAKFNDTFLKEAVFRDAQGLNVNQFEDAKNWGEAKFDKDFELALRNEKTKSATA